MALSCNPCEDKSWLHVAVALPSPTGPTPTHTSSPMSQDTHPATCMPACHLCWAQAQALKSLLKETTLPPSTTLSQPPARLLDTKRSA